MKPSLVQICPKCGYANFATDTKCGECGTALPETDTQADVRRAELPAPPLPPPVKQSFWQKSGGWFAAAIVLFIVLIGGWTASLECTRDRPGDAVNCVRESRFLGMIPTGSRVIEDVRSARVEEMSDEDGTFYRVVLTSKTGDVPIVATYTSGSTSKHAAAKAVNEFIRAPDRTRITVKEPGMLSMENLGCLVIWIVGSVAWSLLKGFFRSHKAEEAAN
ncbi:MAG TPA: hypothetical protein VIU38_03020 [Anaerolineales bacterium]